MTGLLTLQYHCYCSTYSNTCSLYFATHIAVILFFSVACVTAIFLSIFLQHWVEILNTFLSFCNVLISLADALCFPQILC